jgi:hypothetical protein
MRHTQGGINMNRSLNNFLELGVGKVLDTPVGIVYMGSIFYKSHYAVQDIFGTTLYFHMDNKFYEVTE